MFRVFPSSCKRILISGNKMPHTFICRNFRGTDREENERQVEKRENDSQVTHRKNRTLVRQCFLCLCLTSSLFVLIPLFRLTRLFLSFLVINRAWREEGRERSREDRYPGYIKCLQGERRRREGKEKREYEEETKERRRDKTGQDNLLLRREIVQQILSLTSQQNSQLESTWALDSKFFFSQLLFSPSLSSLRWSRWRLRSRETWRTFAGIIEATGGTFLSSLPRRANIFCISFMYSYLHFQQREESDGTGCWSYYEARERILLQ